MPKLTAVVTAAIGTAAIAPLISTQVRNAIVLSTKEAWSKPAPTVGALSSITY